jgi:kynurenine formamidase
MMCPLTRSLASIAGWAAAATSAAARSIAVGVSFASSPVAVGVLLGLSSLAMNGAAAQETPIGPPWWPSKWGAEDERGALNALGTDHVVAAARLIQRGEIYSLGHVYEPEMPLFGGRHYSLTLVGAPSAGPLGENGAVWHDEMFSGQIGQIGTQFDALGHFGVRVGDRDLFYNGFDRAEFAQPYGLDKLGVENVGPIFTRGVLIDVARHKGVARLAPAYEITPADLEAALRAQNVAVRPGDAVLVHTGHGALWIEDNEAYLASAPGIGLDAAKWLVEREIVLVGADNVAVEVQPAADPNRVAEVHQWLLARNGIYLLENLKLDRLAADRAYEFAFVFSPLPLRGATGSPGNPIAVR